jgi:hypothetical protein
MVLSGTFADGVRIERHIFTGDLFAKTTIIEGAEDEAGSPNAFLVEQAANVVLPPHFHKNCQFQLVVRGSGMLGRSHALRPITVHYASGDTGYGPITAGDAGLHYLTLRPVVETGAYYLPQSRDQLDMATPKFQISSSCTDLLPVQELAAITARDEQVLVAPAASGLAAWLVTVPRNASCLAPAHAGGAGRFHVVCRGALLHGGRELPELSCVWTSGDEDPAELQAGAGGAQVAVLQFPKAAQ